MTRNAHGPPPRIHVDRLPLEGARILVEGAREHNLRDVDLAIPRDRLTVITGLSGSGKSSLAFDTLHREGQRRFLESLPAYARQFLDRVEKPRVERVEGLSPTLAIHQKTVSRNPRSTVGTVTEILDHLRLLFARLGVPHCPVCGRTISASTPSRIADRLLASHADERILVLGPVVRARKGAYRRQLQALRKEGWLRARIDGRLRRLDEEITLARYEQHTIEVVVDRLRLSRSRRPRLLEALEQGLRLGEGVVSVLAGDRHRTFATDRGCPDHDIYLPELEPRQFSFNTAQGACPTCDGLGFLEDFEPHLLLSETAPAKSACLAFREGRLPFSHVDEARLAWVVRRLGGEPETPLGEQAPEVRHGLLYGAELSYRLVRNRRGRQREGKTPATERREEIEVAWTGLVPTLRRIWHYTHHAPLARFRSHRTCEACGGARLNPVARAVTFRDRSLPELLSLTVGEMYRWLSEVQVSGAEGQIAAPILRELRHRVRFLEGVGLDYLSLDRPTATLSGGESQRIRLAAQVGSGLQGVTYVLDEPSIGLHPRDNHRLLRTLCALRDRGNTVIVVEHDEDTMRAADHLVELGPGAGREGGRLTGEGPFPVFERLPTVTGAWLRGEQGIPLPPRRRSGTGRHLTVRGAAAHNLAGIDVAIPLGTFVGVTGVSGSGKSTLLFEILEPALGRLLHGRGARPGPHRSLEGVEHLDKVVCIDADPIGRTPRSNPATYTGAFTGIRRLFARVPEARARGYTPGRFSFNVKGGRCETCGGAGIQTLEMQLLADVDVPCEVCGGRRYNDETLEIRYRGRNIHEVLEMTVAEASAFFKRHRAIRRPLQTLQRVGLGYVTLGQPSTTLSGGEAQRIKLARELQRPPTGHTLYLLDEPTTGLHAMDVRLLVDALQSLVDAGNTVMVIEHHLDVVKVADHLLDLGPGGGEAGGQLVGEGPPEHVATLDTPTGHALARLPDLRPASAPPEPAALAAAPPPPRPLPRNVEIRGATRHNLAHIDLEIPKNALTVVTGVSGSGKSSLALHTLFAEGQRRYVESLSTYARRFLGRPEQAAVEEIRGLAPAIAIEQQRWAHNPRSTVATVTEIHDLLRLLWCRIGHPHCHRCGASVTGHDPSRAARLLKERNPGRGLLLAPLGPHREAAEFRASLRREGFRRIHAGGEVLPLDGELAEEALERGASLVVDRFDPASAERSRIEESVRVAYGHGARRARFVPERSEPISLALLPECPRHGPVLPEVLTPRHFSFNSHVGACSRCDGLGITRHLDPDRILADPDANLHDALHPRLRGSLSNSPRWSAALKAALHHLGLEPWKSQVSTWTEEQRSFVLEGPPAGAPPVLLEVNWSRRGRNRRRTVRETLAWPGLYGIIEQWRASFDALYGSGPCPVCRGRRLREPVLGVRVGGLDIAAFSALTIAEAAAFLEALTLDDREERITSQLLPELRARLSFLCATGVGYLTLDRPAHTLSGGENQRIRLASQLGSRLTDTLYVLDEPTIGLHPRDTDQLLATLERLRDHGNTVVVVEHDAHTILRADHVVDLGPGAGERGGRVVATGAPPAIMENPRSLTGAYLAGTRHVHEARPARPGGPPIRLRGARANNLRHLDLDLPTASLVVITGVSGSGKSSLALHTLAPAVSRALGGTPDAPRTWRSLHLPAEVQRLVVVEQRSVGRNPRSTPATWMGIMDPLRQLYARLPEAGVRGLDARSFSYSTGGACPACRGRGEVTVEMHFLSDIQVPCEECRGRRYREQVLGVRWKGLDIASVLELEVGEARPRFENHPRIRRGLDALHEVGLGYLRLGRATHTLSGGEAQRLRLARELSHPGPPTLFLLDEPTTGLHFHDVARLLSVLHALVDTGHTVVVIEHHLDVVRAADHVVDLGPEGGKSGGRCVVQGPPPQVEAHPHSHTGAALRGEFQEDPEDPEDPENP